MQEYSHGQFQVSGYKIRTNSQNVHQDISNAWKIINEQKLFESFVDKAYPSLHNVYFNFTNPENLAQRGYDVLIGFVVNDGSVQTNNELTTITIPPQDYKYLEVKGEMPQAVIEEWQKINSIPQSELDRAFGYDMDMYSEDSKSCTVTVSVNK